MNNPNYTIKYTNLLELLTIDIIKNINNYIVNPIYSINFIKSIEPYFRNEDNYTHPIINNMLSTSTNNLLYHLNKNKDILSISANNVLFHPKFENIHHNICGLDNCNNVLPCRRCSTCNECKCEKCFFNPKYIYNISSGCYITNLSKMGICLECFAKRSFKLKLLCGMCNNIVKFNPKKNLYNLKCCYMGCLKYICHDCVIRDECTEFCPICMDNGIDGIELFGVYQHYGEAFYK